MSHTEIFDIGDRVECDICSKHYPEDDHSEGGFIFADKGVCPDCAGRFEEAAREYGEEGYIRARAEPGEAFRDFILRLRNGDHYVVLMNLDRP